MAQTAGALEPSVLNRLVNMEPKAQDLQESEVGSVSPGNLT